MKVAEKYCCMVSVTGREVGDGNPFLAIWCVCTWVWQDVIITCVAYQVQWSLDFNWEFPCVCNWSYVYPVMTCIGPSVV